MSTKAGQKKQPRRKYEDRKGWKYRSEGSRHREELVSQSGLVFPGGRERK